MENKGDKIEIKKPGPCCVCKETKKERDFCVIEFGEDKCSK